LEALAIAAIVFGPLAFGAVEPWSVTILEATIFSLFVLAILRPTADGAGGGVRSTVLFAALGILTLGILQYAGAGSPLGPAPLRPFTAAAHKTRQALILWAAFAALLWSLPQALRSRPAVRRLAWAVFLIGAAVAVIGISQRGQGNNAYYGLRPVGPRNPFGPYPNHDHAASLMAMSLCAGLGLILPRLDRLRREYSIQRMTEMGAQLALMAFLIAVVGFGIWRTHSRGGILSLCAGLWATAMLASWRVEAAKPRRALRAGLLAAAAAGTAFLLLNPEWIGHVFGTPDISTTYRLSTYRSSLRMLQDFPIFGTGMAAFRDVLPAYKETLFGKYSVQHVHNDWLELAVTMGLPALLAWAGGMIVFLRRMTRLWLDCASREMFLLSAGLMAAVLGFLLHGLVDFSFQIPANAVIFLMLLCLIDGTLRAARTPEDV
jgi:O-antigen ligase